MTKGYVFILAGVALASCHLAALSCTPQQEQVARQVFKVAKGSCTVLEGVTDDPRAAGLCLSGDELKIAMEAVLKARDAAAAALSGSSGVTSAPPAPIGSPPAPSVTASAPVTKASAPPSASTAPARSSP